jgi:ferric-dicitrate binding protein FerR (iron transport regulator)
MSEQSLETTERTTRPASTPRGDSAPSAQPHPSDAAAPPTRHKGAPRRKMLVEAAGALVLAAAVWFGVPMSRRRSILFRRMTRTSTAM